VQRLVDRWFYHERYDHILALKRFTSQKRATSISDNSHHRR